VEGAEISDFTGETIDAAYTFLTESLKPALVANHWSVISDPEQFVRHFDALPMVVTVKSGAVCAALRCTTDGRNR
jgi:hypothetical protein